MDIDHLLSLENDSTGTFIPLKNNIYPHRFNVRRKKILDVSLINKNLFSFFQIVLIILVIEVLIDALAMWFGGYG